MNVANQLLDQDDSYFSMIDELAGDVEIKDIKENIEIVENGGRIQFKYRGFVIGYIDFSIDDASVCLDFIGNSNMNKDDEKLYGVNYEGLYSLSDLDIHIMGLGEFMLREFVSIVRSNYPDIKVITAEIDNPKVIELFTKLKIDNLINGLFEDEETVDDFQRTFLEAYIK